MDGGSPGRSAECASQNRAYCATSWMTKGRASFSMDAARAIARSSILSARRAEPKAPLFSHFEQKRN
jgi:hypothetical protein